MCVTRRIPTNRYGCILSILYDAIVRALTVYKTTYGYRKTILYYNIIRFTYTYREESIVLFRFQTVTYCVLRFG